MSTDERHETPVDSSSSGPNVLNESIRFLRIVRRKLPTLICCMVLGGILGSAWYVTAIRKYESTSEIMVLKTESNVLEGNTSSNQKSIHDVMPTYQKVFTCDTVLEGAVARLPKEHRIDLKGLPKSRWSAELRKNITVFSTRQTSLLTVKYMSKNPKTAAFVVNAVVESYLDYMRNLHSRDSQDNMKLLSEQKAQIEIELQKKERELAILKQESGILLQGEKDVPVVIQNTIKLNDALLDAQRTTIEAYSLIASVENALATGSDIQPLLQEIAGDASKDFMMRELGVGSHDSSAAGKREEELVDDQIELQSRMKTHGPNHPDIIKLKHRIEITKRWLAERPQKLSLEMKKVREQDLGPKLLGMAKQRYHQAKSHEDALRSEFEVIRSEAVKLNGQVAQIESLEMNLKRQRDYYDLILKQMAKVDIGSNSGLKISVTTPAKVMFGAVAPKISTTVVLCIILGGIGGVCLIYVLDVLDDRFRSADELQSQSGLPMLSMIREMEPISGKGLDTIVTFARSDSLESESFRTLRSSITFSAFETRRLVMTSTEPGDGKTTTLANLAVAFAQAKKKTLLIDADLRRPGMTQLLDLKGPRGLSAVLRDTKPIGECCLENIFNLGVDNLDVMPSGSRPANPSELLGNERFSDIIAWAETIYDQILIDAPPVLAVADPAIVGRVLDGAIIVVRPDKNRRKTVLRAIESYRATGVQVIGIVANHIADGNSGDYGYGYSYAYGHDQKPEAESEESMTGYEIDDSRMAA